MLKTRADGTVAAYHDLSSKIATDPAWDFGKSKQQAFDSAKAAFDRAKGTNEFWNLWSMNPNFGAIAKKQYAVEELKKHLANFEKVELTVAELEKLVSQLRGMYVASQMS